MKPRNILFASTLMLCGILAAQPETVKLAGKVVEVGEPKWSGTPVHASTAEAGDWQLFFDEAGNLIGRMNGNSDWEYAKKLASATNREPRKMVTIKVIFLCRYGSVLTQDNGVSRLVGQNIEPFQVQQSLSALARAEVLAEAASGGKLDIVLDVTVDTTWLGGGLQQPETPYSQAVLDRFLPGNINQQPFSTGGIAGPGPYMGVMVVTPAFSRQQSLNFIGKTPVYAFSFNRFSRPETFDFKPHEVLDRQFVKGMRLLADARITGIGDYAAPGALMPLAGITPIVNDAFDAGVADAMELGSARVAPQTNFKSSDGIVSGLSRLDRVNGFVLGALGGRPDIVLAGDGFPRMNGAFAQRKFGDKNFLFVKAPFVDLAVSHWGGAEGLDAVGYGVDVEAGSGLVVIFDITSKQIPEGSDLKMLGLMPSPATRQEPLTYPRAFGTHTLTPADDPQRGKIWQIGIDDPIRQGWVDFGPLTDQKVKFDIRPQSNQPFGVALVDSSGNFVAHVQLVSRGFPYPGAAEEYWSQPVPGDALWHQVVIDFSKFADRGDLHLVAGPSIGHYSIDITSEGVPTVFMTTPVAATENVTPAREIAYANEFHKRLAEGASPAELRTWSLSTNSLNDKLSVAALVLKNESSTDPESVALGKSLAQTLDPSSVEVGTQILLSAKTDEALIALGFNTRVGPLGHHKALAVNEKTPQRDLERGMVEQMPYYRGMMLAELATRPGVEIEAITAGSIQDPDNIVRYLTIMRFNPQTSLGVRRLMFSAANDPSEATRLLARLRLLTCATPEGRAEGALGLNDDSEWVRSEFLLALGGEQIPVEFKPKVQEIIKQALKDRSPLVRSIAISMAAEEKIMDFAAFSNEQQYLPLMALLELAYADNDVLPTELFNRIKSSPFPSLAHRAKMLEMQVEGVSR